MAYWMFVEYCTDASAMECWKSCKMENVYYQQSCEVMRVQWLKRVCVGDAIHG